MRSLWYLHETRVGRELMDLIPVIQPTLAKAHALIAPTQTTAAIYSPFTQRKIHVVPYGIPDLAGKIATTNARLTGAVIGTLEPRKGQDVLLAALALLPAAEVAVKIAGRALDPAFVRQLPADPRVEFLGALEHAAAVGLLRAADFLVLPSRDETMPLVLLEAMSLGKPIVSTDVGGIAEWLRDGENGLLVPPGDPAALAAALRRLLGDSALRARLGRAARATFEEHFALERYGARMAAILQETLA